MIHIGAQLYGQKFFLILATILVQHRTQLLAEVASNPGHNQAMPSPLTAFESMYRLSKCTSEDGPPSNAFSHNCPTSEPNKHKSTRTSPTTDSLRFQCSNAFPNAPPTAKHFPQFSQRFRQFFQGFRFSMVLPDSSMVLFNLSAVLIYSSIVLFDFAGFARFYCYVTAVCLTFTQIHLPQPPPLHRLNRLAPFFHGFISVLPLHSRHTSKSQFFHCFSIVSRVLYPIMVPYRSLNFSIVFPCHQFPSFYFYFIWHHFGPTSQPQFFHCFSYCLTPCLHHSPSIFHCFSIFLLDVISPSIPVSPVSLSQFFLQFYSVVP